MASTTSIKYKSPVFDNTRTLLQMGFASESIVGLKLIECGIHKESLALLAIPLTPLQIVLPLVIAKYTAGPRPMDVFLRAVKYR